MSLDALLSQGWLIFGLLLWTGLSVGSFLNVVVYRLPVMLQRGWRAEAREALELEPVPPTQAFNLMVPRSRCPHCDSQISAWQNIPVFSWLVLRGRCAACNARISTRYPAVEVLTALVSLTVVAVFGYTWDAMFALLFSWLLIAMALIDFDTRLLPDNLTLPLLWLGLLFNLRGGFVDLQSAVIGAAVGYLILWGIYWAFKLLTGKDGMGYGDFKLLAALGAWLGWQALPMVILISSVVGILLGGTVLLIRKIREPIPFGPFLAIAGWVGLVWHDSVVSLVLT
ncbi:MAG: prepilin peptidase [Gammaproteobacteria bacterium]|nr:MAG: prepilin peptidase [Chloroflexota bacterium]TDJ38941.1 MAG: prepilin peptidase [Gammaproteobacteria bacterium]